MNIVLASWLTPVFMAFEYVGSAGGRGMREIQKKEAAGSNHQCDHDSQQPEERNRGILSSRRLSTAGTEGALSGHPTMAVLTDHVPSRK